MLRSGTVRDSISFLACIALNAGAMCAFFLSEGGFFAAPFHCSPRGSKNVYTIIPPMYGGIYNIFVTPKSNELKICKTID